MKKLSVKNRHSLCIAAASTNNYGGTKSVKSPPEDRYYDSNEWYALIKNEKDKVLKALSNRNEGKKSTKSVGLPNSVVGSNNGKWKSKISMLEKKVRNQKSQLSVFNNAAKPGSDDEDSDGSEN